MNENTDSNQVVKYACKLFSEFFKIEPTICSSAPGRVNLIGEHTDYNDGFVLPMALPMVTVIVGRANQSKRCHIFTSCPMIDEPREVEFIIPDDETKGFLCPGKPAWANYLKGVVANFKGKLCGFDAFVATTVPVGGGLSSSAALEVATYTFLEGLSSETISLSLADKALVCQKAEHEFAGTPCGIMDQFISFMGKKDHALLLDCRSLEYRLINFKNPSVTVLITNTNVHHKLAESQYSNRKKQCEKAAEILGKSSLRDVTVQDLESHKTELGDEIYFRALHVVTEIERTVQASKALQEEDFVQFGRLMKESHYSLRDNYEVSCPELDIVVNAALECKGVFGSRMTGGGFGGCTVTLVETESVKDTMNSIQGKYQRATFYVCRPGDGAKMIPIHDIEG
ncbi:galactokinase-like [Uloborus diversus]|uniref:galactokinase-like n=1 Tax=Uloborus diversus TaxID=327109 RepID=UPI0024096309|nr:galactokinase-like [Uloborus diversus]